MKEKYVRNKEILDLMKPKIEKKIYCSAVKCGIGNECHRIGNDENGHSLYACPKCNSLYKVCNNCGEKRMLVLPKGG